MKLYNVATICHKKGQFSLREKQITGLLDAFKDHRHTTAIKYNEVEREREQFLVASSFLATGTWDLRSVPRFGLLATFVFVLRYKEPSLLLDIQIPSQT